jgi:integrase/recombinase XerD
MASVFTSIFTNEFSDLIALKKAQGCKYDAESKAFRRIDEFLVKEKLDKKQLTRELCEKWCRKRSYEAPRNWSHRVSNLRVFAKYLNDIGIEAYVPQKLMGKQQQRYNAHIYTDDELKGFFKILDNSVSLPSECPYRAIVLPVFFRILYTSGLRTSELRLLKLCDMYENECYLVIHDGKNHKDRIVPIHPELARRCSEIRKQIHVHSLEDEYFFMIRPGQPMTLTNLYHNFRRILAKAGISHTGKGPRIHDFRWNYSVNLLKRWVEEGWDLLNWLPYMKTMLGHETFEETAYYLKLTKSMFPNLIMKLKTACPEMIEEVNHYDEEYY